MKNTSGSRSSPACCPRCDDAFITQMCLKSPTRLHEEPDFLLTSASNRSQTLVGTSACRANVSEDFEAWARRVLAFRKLTGFGCTRRSELRGLSGPGQPVHESLDLWTLLDPRPFGSKNERVTPSLAAQRLERSDPNDTIARYQPEGPWRPTAARPPKISPRSRHRCGQTKASSLRAVDIQKQGSILRRPNTKCETAFTSSTGRP